VNLERGFIMDPRANLAFEEDHLYRDFPHRKDNLPMTITFYSKIKIEQGRSHWKDVGQ
jgi:hypothetical protein